jgi:hypothetical protein
MTQAQQRGGIAVTLPWGGEDRTFKLALGQWRAIEAKCNAGPEEIAARLAPTVTAKASDLPILAAANLGLVGRWRIDDVREVVLQGLIGGGMSPTLATVEVQKYIDLGHARDHVITAYAIVSASLEGLPSTVKPGEPGGEGSDPGPSPMAASSGATSTDAADARASRRRKSTR